MATSFNRYFAQFYTKETSNTGFDASGNPTDLIEARTQDFFRTSIIDKADDWVVAVERFEINPNAIPYYKRKLPEGEWIDIYNLPYPAAGVNTAVEVVFDSYSLPDTIKQLNTLMAVAGAPADGLTFTIDAEGFVQVARDAAWILLYHLNLDRAPKLNAILGLDQSSLDIDIAELTSASPVPRWDTGDNMDHLRITSNLPTVSDSIGQSKSNVLTDLSFFQNLGVTKSYAANGQTFDTTSVSYSQRQKIVYNPNERRYLNLRSSAPIDDITVECEYIEQDGTAHIVMLPRGGGFSIKLAFFKKT